jgi:hypothetical protein
VEHFLQYSIRRRGVLNVRARAQSPLRRSAPLMRPQTMKRAPVGAETTVLIRAVTITTSAADRGGLLRPRLKIISAGRKQIAVQCRHLSASPRNISVEIVYVNSHDLRPCCSTRRNSTLWANGERGGGGRGGGGGYCTAKGTGVQSQQSTP